MINIDKRVINNTANEMAAYAENFNQAMQEFLNVIENIRGCWSGQDANTHLNNMGTKLFRELNAIYLKLIEYQVYLSNIPGLYDTVDEIYKNKNINM